MNKRFVCIHGHFYQPPRENPWLEEIEYQESAYPFHDWNERISSECYRANGEVRILDSQGQVSLVVNQYSTMSFNFGPTLLSWMEEHDVRTYEKILEGDRLSQKRFGGHGSAIAQVYNHMIMPLSDWRDKETQVLWGIADFQKRFQRYPESMWLPETAVDTETLEILSDHGMKYVILAPRQAKAYRSLDETKKDRPWNAISKEAFDTKIPYLIKLPSGRSIAAFFYDGAVAKEVAFGGLLDDGIHFANRLNSDFQGNPSDQNSDQLVHIATDGETYGHHHRHGEMALAYALHFLETKKMAVITNYGQFLETHKPQFEAQINEASSWSCEHGVRRWEDDCGCNTGGKAGWHQKWRAPLRQALDSVKTSINLEYDKKIATLSNDPRTLRNKYIDVILNRSDESIDRFILENTGHGLNPPERSFFLKLMEIQRHLQLMYTSCAWFFDDISGIEVVQNLQYAYRAISLAQEILGLTLEEKFENQLSLAPSNLPDIENGRKVFERFVLPSKIDLLKLGAHFAVASIFENYGEENDIYCYRVSLSDLKSDRTGGATLALGQGTISSKITRERWDMTFGVIHLGDHNINAGVSEGILPNDKYSKLAQELKAAFGSADYPNVIRLLDASFGPTHYSLKDLFKNEQTKIINVILSGYTRKIHDRLLDMYTSNSPMISYLSDLHIPLPKIYEDIAEFVQTYEIKTALQSEDKCIDVEGLKKHLDEAKSWKIKLDEFGICAILENYLESCMDKIERKNVSLAQAECFLSSIELVQNLPFSFDLAPIQSRFFLWYHNPDTPSQQYGTDIQEVIVKTGKTLRVSLT